MPFAAAAAAVVGAVGTYAAASKSASAQEHAADQQKQIADDQIGLANEQWNHYLNTYGPVEDQFVQQAKDYGSEANRSQAAADADSAVQGSYGEAMHQLNSTPGLDPSSQAYMNAVSKMGVSEAAQSASAQTGARRNVDEQGFARMQDAASIGKGLPGTASAALSGASASAASLGQLGLAQSREAGQAAAGLGKAAGDLFNNKQFQSTVGGWFSSDEPTDADIDASLGPD